MMHFVLAIFILSASCPLLPSDVYAQNYIEKGSTPYGDNCPLCGVYGYCTKQPTREEAIDTLRSYYEQKGLRIILLRQRNRFLEVEVYRGGNMVDRVLLDLKTGRIRSVY